MPSPGGRSLGWPRARHPADLHEGLPRAAPRGQSCTSPAGGGVGPPPVRRAVPVAVRARRDRFGRTPGSRRGGSRRMGATAARSGRSQRSAARARPGICANAPYVHMLLLDRVTPCTTVCLPGPVMADARHGGPARDQRARPRPRARSSRRAPDIHPDPHGTSAARRASHAHSLRGRGPPTAQSVVLTLEARKPKQGNVDARGGSGGLDT
jgi:hypothetical protein